MNTATRFALCGSLTRTTTRSVAMFTTLIATLTTLGACSSSKDIGQGPKAGLSLNSLAATPVTGLNVVDEAGKPVAGAQILIGSRLNTPFSGNFLTTDATGHIELPAAWTDAQPITIGARGFVRTTYMARAPGAASLALRHLAGDKKFELSGETTGYGDIKDGIVEFSLVMPTFTRAEASVFDPMAIVSSETDTMEVMGQSVEIPSNVAIPEQQQTYYFPLTFNKSKYRYQFSHAQNTKVSAVHITVPTKDLIDSAQGGIKILAMVNKLSFVGGGVSAATIGEGENTLNLPINQYSFTPTVSVVAPNFESTQQMITVAAQEHGGVFAVSDAKILSSGQSAKLNAPNSRSLVVSILRNVQAHESMTGPQNSIFSAVITPASGARVPVDFLEPIKPPTVSTGNLALVPPKKYHGIEPLLTYAVLSKVEVIDHGKYKLEKKTPQWELYASDWVTTMNLPTWPSTEEVDQGHASGAGQRWETVFAGQFGADATPVLAGPQALEKVTHVTRSAVDL